MECTMGVNHQRTLSHPPNVKLPNCMVPNMCKSHAFYLGD